MKASSSESLQPLPNGRVTPAPRVARVDGPEAATCNTVLPVLSLGGISKVLRLLEYELMNWGINSASGMSLRAAIWEAKCIGRLKTLLSVTRHNLVVTSSATAWGQLSN